MDDNTVGGHKKHLVIVSTHFVPLCFFVPLFLFFSHTPCAPFQVEECFNTDSFLVFWQALWNWPFEKNHTFSLLNRLPCHCVHQTKSQFWKHGDCSLYKHFPSTLWYMLMKCSPAMQMLILCTLLEAPCTFNWTVYELHHIVHCGCFIVIGCHAFYPIGQFLNTRLMLTRYLHNGLYSEQEWCGSSMVRFIMLVQV